VKNNEKRVKNDEKDQKMMEFVKKD